jgi:Uma2 family endonuclease
MSTTTRLTFEEFEKLPEQEGVHYELDEGDLLMEPSPTFFRNAVRARIAQRVRDFVDTHQLGYVIEEMDFRLSPDTVRNPDVAFVTTDHLRSIDINRSPVNGAPALAVEVVSPSNLAQNMQKKVKQYFSGGSIAVWVVYPTMSLVEVHVQDGIRQIKAPDSLVEERLFGGRKFTLALSPLFTDPRGQVAENQDRTA